MAVNDRRERARAAAPRLWADVFAELSATHREGLDAYLENKTVWVNLG